MRNHLLAIVTLDRRIEKLKEDRDEMQLYYARLAESAEEAARKAFNMKAAVQETDNEIEDLLATRAFLDWQSPQE